MLREIILALSFLLAISYSWTIDGSAPQIAEHQIARNHEANLFRQRLLTAFRSIDPQVSESTLNRFTRFVRNYDY